MSAKFKWTEKDGVTVGSFVSRNKNKSAIATISKDKKTFKLRMTFLVNGGRAEYDPQSYTRRSTAKLGANRALCEHFGKREKVETRMKKTFDGELNRAAKEKSVKTDAKNMMQLQAQMQQYAAQISQQLEQKGFACIGVIVPTNQLKLNAKVGGVSFGGGQRNAIEHGAMLNILRQELEKLISSYNSAVQAAKSKAKRK